MSFARVRALVFVGVLVLFAMVFGGIALLRDTQAGGDNAASCPDGYQLADVRLREPKNIKINVYQRHRPPPVWPARSPPISATASSRC